MSTVLSRANNPRTAYDAVYEIAEIETWLGLRVNKTSLIAIDIVNGFPPAIRPRISLAREALSQLRAYFMDANTLLNIPLAPVGTTFQRQVWRLLQAIPVGATLSYGQMASQLGSSPRAVGGACRANPIPLFIPCHRVVSAVGLGGFMGSRDGKPLRIKNWLLRHEARV